MGNPFVCIPAVGLAVMWNNWADDGERDLRTHHRGEEVTCPDAEKIGLNAWFHAEKPRRTPWKSRKRRQEKAVSTKSRKRGG